MVFLPLDTAVPAGSLPELLSLVRVDTSHVLLKPHVRV